MYIPYMIIDAQTIMFLLLTIVGLLVIAVISLTWQLILMKKQWSIFMKTPKQITEDYNNRISTSIRGCATVRYDAFADTGGKQSFATAFITESGSGVIISSIYSRARVTTYAKPIQQFKSTYELSVEENQALTEARKSL